MVRRGPVPTPTATRNPSEKPRSGRWHVAHDTVPVDERPRSKKSAWPSAAAASLSAHRLVGSGGGGPGQPISRTRRTCSGISVTAARDWVGAGGSPAPAVAATSAHAITAARRARPRRTRARTRDRAPWPFTAVAGVTGVTGARPSTARARFDLRARDRHQPPTGRTCASACLPRASGRGPQRRCAAPRSCHVGGAASMSR